MSLTLLRIAKEEGHGGWYRWTLASLTLKLSILELASEGHNLQRFAVKTLPVMQCAISHHRVFSQISSLHFLFKPDKDNISHVSL